MKNPTTSRTKNATTGEPTGIKSKNQKNLKKWGTQQHPEPKTGQLGNPPASRVRIRRTWRNEEPNNIQNQKRTTGEPTGIKSKNQKNLKKWRTQQHPEPKTGQLGNPPASRVRIRRSWICLSYGKRGYFKQFNTAWSDINGAVAYNTGIVVTLNNSTRQKVIQMVLLLFIPET